MIAQTAYTNQFSWEFWSRLRDSFYDCYGIVAWYVPTLHRAAIWHDYSFMQIAGGEPYPHKDF